MKKSTIAILAVAVLVLGAIFVVAQKAAHKEFGGRGFGRSGDHRIGMFLRGLDLTDEQKAKVKQIMESSKPSVQPLVESMRENHKKLADLTANGSFDEAPVQAIAAEQGNLTAKLIVEKEKVKAQVFAILTDEQKAKAAQMREQMKQRFENRWKERKGEGEAPKGADF